MKTRSYTDSAKGAELIGSGGTYPSASEKSAESAILAAKPAVTAKSKAFAAAGSAGKGGLATHDSMAANPAHAKSSAFASAGSAGKGGIVGNPMRPATSAAVTGQTAAPRSKAAMVGQMGGRQKRMLQTRPNFRRGR